jgi:subtilisin family serine protease
MTAAMEALRAAGVFMSVSAGNNGPDCGTITDPPAIEPLGFSVGAVDRNDRVAPFSSRGPVSLDGKTYVKPDICAPGVDINAAVGDNGFKKMSGTSMASPHVSGLAILMSTHVSNFKRFLILF